MIKKGINPKAAIEYIKKNKLYFCGGLIALALLVAAFFSGGSLNTDSDIISSDNPVSAYSDYADASADEAVPESASFAQNSNTENKSDKQSTASTGSSDSSSKNAETATASSEKNTAVVDSGVNSQSSKTDNAKSSSSVSPYSKEYYSQNSSQASSSASSSKSQSSASDSSKDKYNTESVPEGKPEPVEPQDQEIEDNVLTCTISISCATILDNLDKFNPDKLELVPEDGWILKPTKVTFNEGESVYDLLVRVCKENEIHMSATWTPIYNSHYIESINNIKEFDCPTDRFHNTSGWMYCVNGWYPNYGVSRYELQDGDVVEFNYTCVGLGADLGADYATGGG